MNLATILIGSNSGDRKGYISKATALVESRVGKLITSSSIFESESWGYTDPTNFYNQIIRINTKFEAIELIEALLNIEKELGRIRNKKGIYLSRTIDLDILFYNSDVINTKTLIVPHPKIQFRKFTLIPLAEIMPEFIHPVLNKPIKTLLKNCSDEGFVAKT